MKFDSLHCPECGEPARGTIDVIHGCALFAEPDENERVDYAGETDVWWEEQTTIAIGNRLRLICPHAHEWWGALIEPAEPISGYVQTFLTFTIPVGLEYEEPVNDRAAILVDALENLLRHPALRNRGDLERYLDQVSITVRNSTELKRRGSTDRPWHDEITRRVQPSTS